VISGTVNVDLEARIVLEIQGTGGQIRQVEAVIDTGFNGLLTLPAALLTALGSPWLHRQQGELADGSIQVFDVHAVTVLWDGQPRTVEAEAVNADPLVGMAMLKRHDLRIQVVAGGTVMIQQMP
jgi:clan AA aspartic protease